MTDLGVVGWIAVAYCTLVVGIAVAVLIETRR